MKFEPLSSVGVIMYEEQILLQRASIYVEITKCTAHAHISPFRHTFKEQILYSVTDLCHKGRFPLQPYRSET